jgi:hypothetical protein
MVKVLIDLSVWDQEHEIDCQKGAETYETYEQALEAIKVTLAVHALRLRQTVEVSHRHVAMLVLLSAEREGEETLNIVPEPGQEVNAGVEALQLHRRPVLKSGEGPLYPPDDSVLPW